MTNEDRREIVNAARSYERIWAEQRGYFTKVVGCHREGRKEDVPGWKAKWAEAGARRHQAERLLARRIYGKHDFVRVDGVVYMAYSMTTVLRVPIDDVPDLADESVFVPEVTR